LKKLVFICALLNLTFGRSQQTDSLKLHFDAGYGTAIIWNSTDLVLNPGPFAGFGFQPFKTNRMSYGIKAGWQGGSVLNQLPLYLSSSHRSEFWSFRFNAGTRVLMRNNRGVIDQSTYIKGRESIQLEILRKLGTGPIYLLTQLSYFRFKTVYDNQFENTDYAISLNFGISVQL
jgi:hypothetical protein